MFDIGHREDVTLVGNRQREVVDPVPVVIAVIADDHLEFDRLACVSVECNPVCRALGILGVERDDCHPIARTGRSSASEESNAETTDEYEREQRLA